MLTLFLYYSQVILIALDRTVEYKFTARLRTGFAIQTLLLICFCLSFAVSTLLVQIRVRFLTCGIVIIIEVCSVVCWWWSRPALHTWLQCIHVHQVSACLAPSHVFTTTWYSIRSSSVTTGSATVQFKPSCFVHLETTVWVFVHVLVRSLRKSGTVSRFVCTWLDQQHWLCVKPRHIYRVYSSCGLTVGYRNTRCRGIDSGMHKHTPLHTPIVARLNHFVVCTLSLVSIGALVIDCGSPHDY